MAAQYLKEMRPLTRAPSPELGGNAIDIFRDGATTHPDAVIRHLDEIRDSLCSNDPKVRGTASYKLFPLATTNPEDVDGVLPDLLELMGTL